MITPPPVPPPLHWLYDSVGCPVLVPSSAIGLRVRYWRFGSRGRGERVIDPATGRPLVTAVDTHHDQFCKRVEYRTGRYRLEPINGRGDRVATPAIFHLTPAVAEHSRAFVRLVELMRQRAAATAGKTIRELAEAMRGTVPAAAAHA